MLQKLNEFKEAVQLTQSYLEEPFKKDIKDYLRLQLSILGLDNNKLELCERNVRDLPSVETARPDIGEAVVNILYKVGKPEDAIKYAYELYRRYPDALQSHRALVAGIFLQAPIGPIEFKKAGVGSAVEYQTVNGLEKGWIILEESSDASPSRNEYNNTHHLYKTVIGKEKGDTFVLRPGKLQNTEATIIQVISKYVYRIQESFKFLPLHFGSESGIEMVSIEGKEPDEYDFSVIFKNLDRHSKRTKDILQMYNKRPMPLAVLAPLLGKGVLVTMAGLHRETNRGSNIYCCEGRQEEFQHAQIILHSAKAIVADITALSTLILANALELIPAIGIPVVVSEGVLKDLRNDAQQIKYFAGSEGSLSKVCGRYTFTHANTEEQKKWLERLTQSFDYIEEYCQVVGGECCSGITSRYPKKTI